MGSKSNYAIPVALVLAGVIIAGAIIYSNKVGGSSADDNQPKSIYASNKEVPDLENKLKAVRTVDSSDRIKGNLQAPLKVVVYGDLECPACRYFDGEINKVYQAYASTSQMVIAMRHFPLPFHQLAEPLALTAECMREQGGDEKFFQYVEKVYEETPEGGQLPRAKIASIATDLGANAATLKACVDSKKYKSVIERDTKEATVAGAPGTPYVVIFTPKGERKAIFGGVPAEVLKPELDKLLTN